MLSETHLKLMPSRELRDELQKLQTSDPRIAELSHPRVFPMSDDAFTFALGPAGERAYPMSAIPVPGRPGRLFLGRLPGRYGHLERELDAIACFGIHRIVCLLPEIDIADPELYNVPRYVPLVRERFGDRFHLVEVMDYEAPGNDQSFEALVRELDKALAQGEAVLSHCGAGCGRVGMFAACLLAEAGMESHEAVRHVRRHRGCGPESPDQVAYAIRFGIRRGAAQDAG